MVFKKLLAGLGLGGVETDTVLSPHPATPGGSLSGEVRLRAKSEVEITAITIILVANGAGGEVELARHPVTDSLTIASGSTQQVPFTVTVPAHAPFTALYGQLLPGISVGVRTEIAVVSGKAKGDFDPTRLDATPTDQQIMDALGAIGCRFVRNELRPGQMVGLPVPAAQAVTFYAPILDGQQPGPHIPLLTFTVTRTASDDGALTVLTELAGHPGPPDRHDLSTADIERLSAAEGGWIGEVDGWVMTVLEKLSQPATAPGSFLQQQQHPQSQGQGHGYGYGQPGPGQPRHGQPGQGYAYGGRGGQQGYRYSGHQGRPGMGGAIAAGVGGAALGFLGGMMIGDMIGGAMGPDMADAAGAVEDPAMAAGGFEDAGGGFEDSGGGGFDDFGGGFEEF